MQIDDLDANERREHDDARQSSAWLPHMGRIARLLPLWRLAPMHCLEDESTARLITAC